MGLSGTVDRAVRGGDGDAHGVRWVRCGRVGCDLVEKIANRAVVAASVLARASAIVANVAFLAARAPALAMDLRLVARTTSRLSSLEVRFGVRSFERITAAAVVRRGISEWSMRTAPRRSAKAKRPWFNAGACGGASDGNVPWGRNRAGSVHSGRDRWRGVSGGVVRGAVADRSFAQRVSMRAGYAGSTETARRVRCRCLASGSHKMER